MITAAESAALRARGGDRRRGRAGALLLGLIVAMAPLAAARAEDPPAPMPDCVDGKHSNDAADFRICMPPEGRWNNDLVVYAHGYVSPFEPVGIPESQLVLGGVSLPKLITDLGFAFATTGYSGNGLVIPEAVEDVVDLVDVFTNGSDVTPPRMPRRVYLVGPSEGGAVTAFAIEKHGDVFDGGIAACGPIGSFRAQVGYFGDFRVLFDVFFPGVLPGSPVDIPLELVANWETVYVPAITQAVAADPDAAAQLLRVSSAPSDAADPSTVLQTIIDVLWYNVFATNDATVRLGGQPYDNRFRWYFGSDDDVTLNQTVQRIKADPAALAKLASTYETSGRPASPLVLMHTTGDPVIRYWNQPLYLLKTIGTGFRDRVLRLPILRYGHCHFTAPEALIAFGLLLLKVEGSQLANAEQALPTPQSRAEYRALQATLDTR